MTIIALLPLFILSGCNSGPTTTPANDSNAAVAGSDTTSAAPTTAPDNGPSGEDLRAYFEAIASGDPQEMLDAAELAAPGSNAAAYATYYSAVSQAFRDSGVPSENENLKEVDGGFALCPEYESEDNPCTEFTNLQHKGDRLADFETQGKKLKGRISLGDGTAQPLGEIVEAELIASYKSVANDLIIVFDASSNSAGAILSATYVAPDGRQANSSLYYGPLELDEGSFGTFAFYFEGAEFGGDVTLEAYSGDGYDSASAKFSTN